MGFSLVLLRRRPQPWQRWFSFAGIWRHVRYEVDDSVKEAPGPSLQERGGAARTGRRGRHSPTGLPGAGAGSPHVAAMPVPLPCPCSTCASHTVPLSCARNTCACCTCPCSASAGYTCAGRTSPGSCAGSSCACYTRPFPCSFPFLEEGRAEILPSGDGGQWR